ncbi:DNA primase [Agrilactobacillus fermenti]
MLARIPETVIEDIRSQVNIVDVISQYVQLKKSGKNLFGLCPFHEEKTPSFSVAEDKQIFHCFSCGRGGNVFKFIMDIENLSFPEAVIKVAQMNQISIDPQYLNTQVSPQEQGHQTLKQMHQDAQALFHHILVNTQTGQQALKYLHDRGMTDETINTFGIGYAPAKADLLTLFFKEKHYDAQALLDSGLFATTNNGQKIDRFVDRVMFPIKDQGGATIAFSGRALTKDPNMPKYLNSPETPIFNKRRVLFNYDLAKHEIREAHSAILLEGFMDVISAYQAGVKNGVASMGTSLTDDQLYALKRTTDHLIICYDGDEPGVNAANRAVDMLQNQSQFSVGIVVLPDDQDPDEFIKHHGAAAFRKIISNTEQTALGFKLRYLRRNINLQNEKAKFDYLDKALYLLKSIGTPTQQSTYAKQLAQELQLDPDAVLTQLAEVKLKENQHGQQPKAKYQKTKTQASAQILSAGITKFSRVEQAERLLLYYLLHDEATCRELVGHETFNFVHTPYQTIFELWLTFTTNHDNHSISAFIDQLPAELQNVVAEIEMSQLPSIPDSFVINDLLEVIARQDIHQQLQDAQAALKIANETGNFDEELHWTNEIIRLSRYLKGA